MYKNSTARRTRRSSNFANQRPRHSSNYRGNRGGGNRGGGRRNKQNIDPRRFIKAAKPIEQTIYTAKNSFADFEVHDLLKRNLSDKGFQTPTQIQDQAIPIGLQGKDVIGIANTGTGKTAAFLLPILQKLMVKRGEKALIVAPTRELALQIQQESRDFARGVKLWDVLLIGGTPIGRQFRELKRRPEIIIGTPGRIKDHIERGTLDLGGVTTIVLDEVDRMLDMGFITDIRMILGKLPSQRQSFFFSATMSPTIESLIRTFTDSPITVMAKTSENSDNVDQSLQHYHEKSDKIERLHEILIKDDVKKTLIFSETKRSVERLSQDLVGRGFKAAAMHGDKSQSQRQRALRSFRDDFIDILVATDVAARGIDVNGISHVVNYDLPQTFDDYSHRIGRTGRGSNIGYAVTFVSQRR